MRSRRKRNGDCYPAAAPSLNSTFVLCTGRKRCPIPSTGAGLIEGHDRGRGTAAAAGSARERGRALGERPAALGRALRTRGRAQARHVADAAPADGGPALSPVASLVGAARERVRLRAAGGLLAKGNGNTTAGAQGPSESEGETRAAQAR